MPTDSDETLPWMPLDLAETLPWPRIDELEIASGCDSHCALEASPATGVAAIDGGTITSFAEER